MYNSTQKFGFHSLRNVRVRHIRGFIEKGTHPLVKSLSEAPNGELAGLGRTDLLNLSEIRRLAENRCILLQQYFEFSKPGFQGFGTGDVNDSRPSNVFYS